MSDARRAEILQLAKQELRRSHQGRRRRRSRTMATIALLTVVSAVGSVWLLVREPADLSGDSAVIASGPIQSPLTTPVAVDAPKEPIASTKPRTAERPPSGVHIEIVTASKPSAGFATVLDDLDFHASLRSLPTPTGVAVIDGRTRIVANPNLHAGEPIQ